MTTIPTQNEYNYPNDIYNFLG